jgi:hypothetical protein
MFRGPITSSCSPVYADAVYTIESYVVGSYRQTVERETVKEGLEQEAFAAECARIQGIRKEFEDKWGAVCVRILIGDCEIERKIIQ